jgi:TatD DNase family protein
MKHAVRALAELTGFTYQDVARITSDNARRLFRIAQSSEAAIAYPIRNRMYLNITNRCTNNCCFCEKHSDYRLLGHYLKLPGEPSTEEILAVCSVTDSFEEYVICGLGEPTYRLETVLALAKALKKRGCRVRLNTNGHGNLIHGRDITPSFVGLLDSVSVAMNAHDQKRYNKISCPDDARASFQSMIEFASKVKKYVPDVRMRVVAMPEVDIESCRRIAEDELKVRFQIRPYRPDGYPKPLAN